MKKKNFGSVIQNIDKDHYLDLRTGELKQKNHIEHRGQDAKAMRKTLNSIRALVNTNVVDPSACRWVTFTYAQGGGEPMTDLTRLYGDFKRFWMRLKRHCSDMGYGLPEYLSVVEPQGNGAWHVHAFLIWGGQAPFIPNDAGTVKRMKYVKEGVKTMSELWGQGYTTTKALSDCDNIGAYFSAYLGDMPFDELEKLPQDEVMKAMQIDFAAGVTKSPLTVETKKFVAEDGTIKSKQFVKGGRLYLYPPGMNIVRKSKGIKEPSITMMDEAQAQKKVSAATETFSCDYEIIDDSGSVVNAISKRYYNKRRKRNQD